MNKLKTLWNVVTGNTGNAILTLFPYKKTVQLPKGQVVLDMWMFDDPSKGLVEEAFVMGIDEMLDVMTADIPNARDGVKLTFATVPFPNYQVELVKGKREGGGRWYHAKELDITGWLCPALFKYFIFAPKKLYARVDPLPVETSKRLVLPIPVK